MVVVDLEGTVVEGKLILSEPQLTWYFIIS
jgi:hypothetical protein